MGRHEHLHVGDAVVEIIVDDGAPADAGLLVYHHGTPAAGPLSEPMLRAARGAGLRLVELVRPGYGASTRAPGRRVADVVPLVTAVADHLHHDRFVSIGWSGGGPHVLATAAALPDRCVAALCLAGVAPVDAVGLNWLAGMGEDNWHEFGAALAGSWALEKYLTEAAAELAGISAADVVSAMASLLPEADRASLASGGAAHMAEELRFSVAAGIWGWHDDDIAFVTPWGVDPASITVPVLVWQGTDDLMVPVTHGRWLAATVPTAQPTIVEGEGHLSLEGRLDDGLRRLGDLLRSSA
jgi:pimeloyl-ACP methyl ester carboxylesterase